MILRVRAWAWLAAETNDLAEKVRCLEEIVALDPDLEWATTYYWQIIEDDLAGTVIEGPIWEFTTAAGPVCDPPLTGDVTGDCSVDLSEFADFTSPLLLNLLIRSSPFIGFA